MSADRTPERFVPGLQPFPRDDRRRIIEGLRRRALRCISERSEVIGILVHGELADRADARGTTVELLVVVEETEGASGSAAYRACFEGLSAEPRVEVETRTGLQRRAGAGDPELARLRDRAVLLAGALPLDEGQAW